MKPKINIILALPFILLVTLMIFPSTVYQDTPREGKKEISGRAAVSAETGIVGLPGVKITFSSDSGGTVSETTDLDGHYRHEVPEGWSGTVTPVKIGYSFAPAAQHYENVITDMTDQDYTASQTNDIISISGRITTAEGLGIAGVILAFTNDQESSMASMTVTDAAGNYNLPVESGWTGVVTPSKQGYTFNPPSITYENIDTHRLDQDYTVSQALLVVSGRVIAGDGTGISGVTLTFSNGAGSTITDFNGNYRHGVPHGWFGLVSPGKRGYEFEPSERDYQNITSDRPDQDYAAEADSPVVSGIISSREGIGIAGVTLTFSNNGGTAGTDADGKYHHAVERSWSGTVSPAKTGYTFSPAETNYDRVRSDLPGQDYSGTALYPVISGKVAAPQGTGIPGVQLNFSNGGESTHTYSNAAGMYHHAVPSGWSGSVTPSKSNYTFSPGSLTYENVTADLSDRDYTAFRVLPVVSGRIAAASGMGVGDVFLVFSPDGGSTATNAGGIYIHEVNPGWSGEVTPSKASYTFSPPSLSYDGITGSRFQQDYTAIEHLPVISGVVTASTTSGIQGLAGVLLTFSNDGGTAVTDDRGRFEHYVPIGWSGTLTLEKTGYIFLPSSQAYSNVTGDLGGQNFVALPGSVTLTLQATRKIAGALLIKKHYGEIRLTVEIVQTDRPLPISSYIISRKEQDGIYQDIEEVINTDLPGGGTYVYIDRNIEPDKNYTYKARAQHESGLKIKESNEQNI